MVKKIIVTKLMSDEEIASKEGEHIDESMYHTILNEDADVYTDDGRLIIKFRKNVIPKNLTDMALECYRDAAKKKHENRGASAGVLDRNKMANYIGDFVNPGKFRTKFVSSVSGVESKQCTSNLSPSNIIGYYDKPDRNLKGTGAPCRLTAYNRDHPELWEKSIPFLQKCSELFKKLIPDRYEVQYKRCQEVPEFAIPGTAFSTITINYSWRTSLHRDAGDLREGFGNLIVIEDHKNPNYYQGCYTGFPQYGVAVNARTGDFCAMDVHEWHANTEFKPVSNTNINLDNIEKETAKRDIINEWHYNRLAIVCYLRENMIRCKNMSTDKIQLLNLEKPEKPSLEKIVKKPGRKPKSTISLDDIPKAPAKRPGRKPKTDIPTDSIPVTKTRKPRVKK